MLRELEGGTSWHKFWGIRIQFTKTTNL